MSRVKHAPAPMRMQDRPGRWKLIWRRQRQMLRPALAGSALIAAFLLVGGLVHTLGDGADFRERMGNATASFGLRIQTIVIEGRNKTPEPLVRAALGVRSGDPILTFSVADARARLETINWVQSATVERRLPGTILVQLTERRPFAVWQHEGKFALIDRDGDMVTDSDVAAFAGQLPLVVGIGAPKAAAFLLDALAAQPDLQARTVAAVRVGERRWNLRMNNGTDILLPEGAEVQALARLVELQASHALLDRPLQAVDLRLPDRLVVRPLPDPSRNASGPARKPT
ncbi:cell division protein FtsQ/DivIB [Limobrevibacterium gyesilva]|uniref:Cell division protein FtsQ n=1 Tax=Limobrevibacterium gyesilva TaxID=2991712 RepID=A0AA41YWY0_9PROT|nr:cell division protein FtsQ/DivIB [Limobrevibacterium gyesilva]MCW3477895.1 FtsQ-type POTRA domain-containing protein [Limobrevibacterium gyesilva]